ncbi:unnamed protein product [Paramecium primaurelia]|uniref:Uncharacterized protein n=1 Tax=Paramecium primaurelia TaxID=5886 RepID=A0A8S1NYJ8_PARPR|nr:unnamed protein product [Paramecium primaurelia]
MNMISTEQIYTYKVYFLLFLQSINNPCQNHYKYQDFLNFSIFQFLNKEWLNIKMVCDFYYFKQQFQLRHFSMSIDQIVIIYRYFWTESKLQELLLNEQVNLKK